MPRVKKQHLKRRADGRFACRYKNLWFYGDTEDDALAQREAYKQAERRGEFAEKTPYFGEYSMRWLSAYKAHLTTEPYNQHVRNLLPVFHRLPIANFLIPNPYSLFPTSIQ